MPFTIDPRLGDYERLNKRFQKAKSDRANWEQTWRIAYDMTMPVKNRWNQQPKGEYRRHQIYDSTAVEGVSKFATRIMAALTPSWSQWAKLTPGADIDPDLPVELDPAAWPEYEGLNAAAALELITDKLFEFLHYSNFQDQMFEACQDLAISIGTLMVNWRDGGFNFVAVPLYETFVEEGPNGVVKTHWRQLEMAAGLVPQIYPDAELPRELQKCVEEKPTETITLVEGEVHLPPEKDGQDEAWQMVVLWENEKAVIFAERHESSPWITFPWAKASHERYGRGPVIQQLGDILTVNKMMEHKLKADAFAVMGLWTGVNDGVWNPNTVQLVPGTIIPVATNDSTNPSLRPLDIGGAPQIVDVDLEQLRRRIQNALFSNPLGEVTDTPVRTLGENMMRMRDMLEQAGASFGVLESQLLRPLIERLVYLLTEEGEIPALKVDGKQVSIEFTSPLAQARDTQELSSVVEHANVMAMLSPATAQMLFHPERTNKYVQSKTGVPESIFMTPDEKQQAMEQMAAMAQQMQGAENGGQPAE